MVRQVPQGLDHSGCSPLYSLNCLLIQNIVGTCHNIIGPGINGPGGPFMSSYLVRPDHLCIDINGPGKT